MKLVSYLYDEQEQLGLFFEGHVYNLHSLHKGIPHTMQEFLDQSDEFTERIRPLEAGLKDGSIQAKAVVFYELLAPVPHPRSCRDGYAFRQHVETARRNRGLEMISEFDRFPVFYFTNHQAVYGPGEVWLMPDHFNKLDFELEVAIVIGKRGRNIPASQADSHIAGFMIMNDLSARKIQMEEMLLNLGPAKGKDFATVFGPWLVTPDELESFSTSPIAGHTGKTYDLAMRCWVNKVLLSEGNMKDMHWTFAELIERASYGADLYPGDVIGSGTVGTGCLLELNGAARLKDPAIQDQWLGEDDLIEMEITGLGHLSTTLCREKTSWSLEAGGQVDAVLTKDSLKPQE